MTHAREYTVFIVFNKPTQLHGAESIYGSKLFLSYSRNSPCLMETASSIQFSVKPSTYRQPEPDESSLRPSHPTPLKSILILSSLYALFFSSGFPNKTLCIHILPHAYNTPCPSHSPLFTQPNTIGEGTAHHVEGYCRT